MPHIRLQSHGARWYRPTAILRSLALRPRVYFALAAVALALLLLPTNVSVSLRSVLAADAGFLVYLLMALRIISSFSPDAVRRRASRQDHGGLVILAIILLAIAASFVAIAGLLAEAKASSGSTRIGLAALAAGTVMLSWIVTQVVFTFHYAHEYYSPRNAEGLAGGLEFPKDTCPDYWDFLYFATSIGATSQTSDVSISSKGLRRLAALHAIGSFFFNAAVLALAINIGSSLF